jgi:hypothetical protein
LNLSPVHRPSGLEQRAQSLPDAERYGGRMTPRATRPILVERVDVNVRMERKIVQVLDDFASHREMTLGEVLEKIVLHSFEAVPGQGGEMCASPFSKGSLALIADLKTRHGMDFDTHDSRLFHEESE